MNVQIGLSGDVIIYTFIYLQIPEKNGESNSLATHCLKEGWSKS